MRKNFVALLAGVVLVVAAAVAFAAVAGGFKPQTTCPVTGKPIDVKTSPHVDWQGQRIYFADGAAADAFRKDPARRCSPRSPPKA